MTPKGQEEYRGIWLVEVMWKVVAEILHLRLTASITYHDFLHGFRAGRGTGTATVKAKLLQKLAAMREEVLYVIFLDLHKATTPWTGPGAYRSWKGTGLDPELDDY